VVAQPVQFALADPGEGQREEHQQHVLDAAIVAEGDGLLVLVAQGEVGGGGSDAQHQRFPARDFGWTKRLALQLPRLTDEVGIRPAVGAASAISEGNTCPGLPVLGVSTQITPSSASEVMASIRVSTRSPSLSRHHNRTTSITSSESSSRSSPRPRPRLRRGCRRGVLVPAPLLDDLVSLDA